MTSTTPRRKAVPRHKEKKLNLNGNEIIADGLDQPFWHDMYHQCMTVTWPVFFSLIALAFLLLNLVFGLLYQLQPGSVANQFPQGLAGAFFFSVETIATVGYGDMHPATFYAHVVATVEIFTGMMGVALITGMVFARFSRPRARVIFTANPVVRKLDGQQALMLRAANGRLNVVAEANARLRMLRLETSQEGIRLRRIYDLKLLREQTSMFVMSWTLIHMIDENSPLHGLSAADLAKSEVGLVLSLEGTDETTSQNLHARKVFNHSDILWNHGFADMLYVDEEGRGHIDYDCIHKVVPLDAEGRVPLHAHASHRSAPIV
jgi:inward rectifier potassium channel